MKINRVDPSKIEQLSRLANLAQPVKQLYYFGNFLELLDSPRVAIVGSRKVSPYGKIITTSLASGLARAGVVVVSGLAIGVDSIAHQAVLDAGGKTIAILPSGLDSIYPASHQNLAKKIVEQGGAIVTEYMVGQGMPMKHQFIARNRIIANLTSGVLITEAAAKSGSLHTADFALESAIEVLVVPGNITSATSVGTNNLIKSGATPVTEVQDILDELNIKSPQNSGFTPGNEIESAIIKLLESGIHTTDELIEHSSLTASQFNQAITMLEINEKVKSHSDSWWII